MQYKTNQLQKTVLFSNENYQNITQNFWVYKFITLNPSYQYSLIDDLKQDLPNVKSVVYLQGKAFYALFEKAKFKNDFELEDKIKSVINNNEEVQFSQITNLIDENEIDKRHLAQLLFNSLANTSSKNAKCSNITGSLYWVVDADSSKDKSNPNQNIVWQYTTLKLELDYYLHLKLEVKTFSNLLRRKDMDFANRKTKFEDYPQYEIMSDNFRTMRRLKSNETNKNPSTTYINVQYKKNGKLRKNTVSFLDFSGWNSFEMSKSGVLYLFLKEVKEQLSEYITIQFVELPFSEEKTAFDKKLSDNVKAQIKSFYQSKPIVIIIADSLKEDQEANKLAQDLQTFLTDQDREYKVPNVSIGNLSENALNIRIIRNKDYYKSSSFTDEYCNDKNFLIHHITTDDFDIELEKTKKGERRKLFSSPAVDVILKESYIKNDIKKGQITILDWNFGEWLFMDRAEIRNNEKLENNGEKRKPRYWFRVLKVFANGTIDFEVFEDITEFKKYSKEINKLLPYLSNDDKHWEERVKFKALVISNEGDMNFIEDTPKFTIQEIEKIGRTLELESQDDDKFLNQTIIINVIKDFYKSPLYKEKDKESLDKVLSLLEKYKPNFSKKELFDLFGKEKANLSNKGENHLQGRFCRFYEEKTGDVLKSFFRGKSEKEGLLSSRLDIFYQVNETKTEAFYFVGEISEGIQSKFQNATNIRKIKAVKNLKMQQSKLVFDQILQTMAVDFVKQGSLTVLPFPFKYLREISKVSF